MMKTIIRMTTMSPITIKAMSSSIFLHAPLAMSQRRGNKLYALPPIPELIYGHWSSRYNPDQKQTNPDKVDYNRGSNDN
jgi:hypothetical protein